MSSLPMSQGKAKILWVFKEISTRIYPFTVSFTEYQSCKLHFQKVFQWNKLTKSFREQESKAITCCKYIRKMYQNGCCIPVVDSFDFEVTFTVKSITDCPWGNPCCWRNWISWDRVKSAGRLLSKNIRVLKCQQGFYVYKILWALEINASI